MSFQTLGVHDVAKISTLFVLYFIFTNKLCENFALYPSLLRVWEYTSYSFFENTIRWQGEFESKPKLIKVKNTPIKSPFENWSFMFDEKKLSPEMFN